jgi:hypothetical protein
MTLLPLQIGERWWQENHTKGIHPESDVKNCGCPLCYQDPTELGCEYPGECIETAKMLIDSILSKWNPMMVNLDLCEELEWNKKPLEIDQVMVFDPNFTLSKVSGSLLLRNHSMRSQCGDIKFLDQNQLSCQYFCMHVSFVQGSSIHLSKLHKKMRYWQWLLTGQRYH